MLPMEELRKRLGEVLSEFRKQLEMLENGEMTTRTNNIDDTAETIAWIRARIEMLREAQRLVSEEQKDADRLN